MQKYKNRVYILQKNNIKNDVLIENPEKTVQIICRVESGSNMSYWK